MGIKLANNASSRLAASLTASDTTLSVMPGDGAKFPELSPGDYFMATIVSPTGLLEIVKCTARSSDTFTVERSQEGTQPRSFNAGDVIQCRFTAGTFDNALSEGMDEKLAPINQSISDLQDDVGGLQDALDDTNSGLSSKLPKEGGTATGLKYTVSAQGNTSGAKALNLATANEFTATITGNTTFSFSNPPASGESQIVYLRLVNAGSYTITWPANTKFDDATAPELTASGVDLIGVKYDSTTSTYMVFVIGLNVGVAA